MNMGLTKADTKTRVKIVIKDMLDAMGTAMTTSRGPLKSMHIKKKYAKKRSPYILTGGKKHEQIY